MIIPCVIDVKRRWIRSMHNKSIIVAATFLTLGLYPQAIAAETQIAAKTAAVETVVRTDVDATWDEQQGRSRAGRWSRAWP